MRKQLHEALVAVRDLATAHIDNDKFCSGAGICYNMENYMCDSDVAAKYFEVRKEVWELMHEAFEAWPKFSGELDFPVPGEYDCWTEYNTTKDKWDLATQYGKDRMELLEFMIDYFAEEKA